MFTASGVSHSRASAAFGQSAFLDTTRSPCDDTHLANAALPSQGFSCTEDSQSSRDSSPAPSVCSPSKRSRSKSPRTFSFTSATTLRRAERNRKKNKNYIPRPPNSFMLFRVDFVAKHRGDGWPKVKLSKRASDAWWELTKTERQHWVELAKEAREHHARQWPDYKYRPRRREELEASKPKVTRRQQVESCMRRAAKRSTSQCSYDSMSDATSCSYDSASDAMSSTSSISSCSSSQYEYDSASDITSASSPASVDLSCWTPEPPDIPSRVESPFEIKAERPSSVPPQTGITPHVVTGHPLSLSIPWSASMPYLASANYDQLEPNISPTSEFGVPPPYEHIDLNSSPTPDSGLFSPYWDQWDIERSPTSELGIPPPYEMVQTTWASDRSQDTMQSWPAEAEGYSTGDLSMSTNAMHLEEYTFGSQSNTYPSVPAIRPPGSYAPLRASSLPYPPSTSPLYACRRTATASSVPPAPLSVMTSSLANWNGEASAVTPTIAASIRPVQAHPPRRTSAPDLSLPGKFAWQGAHRDAHVAASASGLLAPQANTDVDRTPRSWEFPPDVKEACAPPPTYTATQMFGSPFAYQHPGPAGGGSVCGGPYGSVDADFEAYTAGLADLEIEPMVYATSPQAFTEFDINDFVDFDGAQV